MSKVFVLDTNKQALNPVHPGRARKLLSNGEAAVFKQYPFTIILKCAVEDPIIEPLRIKLDPGSKTTGIAVVNDDNGEVVFAAQLEHRGQDIANSMKDRLSLRRGRRSRKTRYRKPRWLNRRASHRKGIKSPSLNSRVSNSETWVKRIQRVCPIAAISLELVKFDMQQMDNPEISGSEYQQGTLAGYEAKEYLLEKWGHKCAYCGKENVPLEVEHIVPRSKGGSNRISNLTIACCPCNKAKNNKDIKDFLAKKPELLKKILAYAKVPLKDAAAVNSTRWELYRRLQSLGMPIECGTGGRTKWNRTTRVSILDGLGQTLRLDKTHWSDAACVGASTPDILCVNGVHPLLIKATGHGNRQVVRVNGYGFPEKTKKDERPLVTDGRLSGNRKHAEKCLVSHKKVGGKLEKRPTRRIGEDKRETISPREHKYIHGFQTGDVVKVTQGKYNNRVGRMTAQSNGSFYMGSPAKKNRASFSYKYCQAIHRNDGYKYLSALMD